MNETEILLELMKHMEWADSIVWKSVITFNGSEGDNKLKEILFHYYRVQQVYLQMWNEQSIDISVKDDTPETLRLILERVIQYYEELNEFINNIEEYDLNRIIIVPWVESLTKILGRAPEKVNLTETVLQVAVHSSHHRGQVYKRLREIGGEPATIDFIAWGWMGKPAADWKKLTE